MTIYEQIEPKRIKTPDKPTDRNPNQMWRGKSYKDKRHGKTKMKHQENETRFKPNIQFTYMK